MPIKLPCRDTRYGTPQQARDLSIPNCWGWQHRRVGVSDHILELGLGSNHVQRHRDATAGPDGQLRDYVLDARREQETSPVTRDSLKGRAQKCPSECLDANKVH